MNATTTLATRRVSEVREAFGIPRVAVVGAGPAGLYAVQSLLEGAPGFGVDVFDRLPTPYGLVRYGVAPDKQKIKSVTRVLRSAFEHGEQVRFIGNVCFGVDVTRADLLEQYDAVVYATGAQSERTLGIPGEDLPGSYSAKAFVDWYSGHPDAANRNFVLRASQVAVIGAGNIAIDVARMLLRRHREIASTDVPDRVLDAFCDNQVTDVHLIARRGPVQAKFTPEELRGFADLTDIDIVVRPEEIALTDDEERRIDANRQLRTNVALLRDWARRPLQGKPRRIHIRFLRSPVHILGMSGVEGIVLERNELSADERVRRTGDLETLDVSMVFRAVGYEGLPLGNVPFDKARSIIPNIRGRVLDESGELTNREYVSGWAKRGPCGTIGTNKSDSTETISTLLSDLPPGGPCKGSDPNSILNLLDSRGVNYTHWANWLRLDSHEVLLGQRQGRPRVKIPALNAMLDLSRPSNASSSPEDRGC